MGGDDLSSTISWLMGCGSIQPQPLNSGDDEEIAGTQPDGNGPFFLCDFPKSFGCDGDAPVDNRPVGQKQNKELHGIDAARHDVLHKYEEATKKRKRLLEEQQALESKLQVDIARCNQARKDGDHRLQSMMDHMSIDRIHMGRVSDKLKKNQELLDEIKEEAHSGGRSVWRDKHVADDSEETRQHLTHGRSAHGRGASPTRAGLNPHGSRENAHGPRSRSPEGRPLSREGSHHEESERHGPMAGAVDPAAELRRARRASGGRSSPEHSLW